MLCAPFQLHGFSPLIALDDDPFRELRKWDVRIIDSGKLAAGATGRGNG
jgi:hypothetical protein